MFPREVKEIDWKQYIEYKGFKEMRDMESKVEWEKIELFKENKKLKEELKKDNREVQVDVDRELLKANDYLIKENKKLKEENKKMKAELEFYKKQYEHSMWEDYIDKDLYDLDC